MTHMRSLILCLTATLLFGCGPQYQTQSTFVPPATETGRMCANNCLLSKQNCQQSCSLQQSNCEMRARLEADNDYLQYVNERQREGKQLKKSRSDFSGSSVCPEVETCQNQCESNHRLCHSNCGGQVIDKTICVANCQP